MRVPVRISEVPKMTLEDESSVLQRRLPVILILLSALSLSLSNCCVRYITTKHNTEVIFIFFVRSVLQAVVTVFLLYTAREQNFKSALDGRSILFLLFRGFLGAIFVVCKYSTLTRLPVAVGTSLFSTSSLFASAMGWLFLDVGLTLTDGASLLLTLSGAGLVGLSSYSSENSGLSSDVEGFALGLLTAATGASIFVSMRWMGTSVHFLLSVLANSLCSIPMAFFLYFMQNSDFPKSVNFFYESTINSSRDETIGFFAVALFAILGSFGMNYGAQHVAPGRSSLLRSCDIPLNFTMAFLFLGELPSTRLQAVGCVLMAVSAYLVATKSGA